MQNLVAYDLPVGDKGATGVGANASIVLHNDYPLGLDLPSFGLDLFLPGCSPSAAKIQLAHATTGPTRVRPGAEVVAEVAAVVRDIPEPLTRDCPQSRQSPLDKLVQGLLQGKGSRLYLRAAEAANPGIPAWLASLLGKTMIPIDVPGQPMDDLIRNFSLTDVSFKLPSPFDDPNDPRNKPRVSGTMRVEAALPAQLKANISVDGIAADGNLSFQQRKFGELRLQHWQQANSTVLPGRGSHEKDVIVISSRVVDAPLDITDSAVFAALVQSLLLGGDGIILDVDALVDAQLAMVLGKIVLKGVPAHGRVPVERPSLV